MTEKELPDGIEMIRANLMRDLVVDDLHGVTLGDERGDGGVVEHLNQIFYFHLYLKI